MPLGQKPSPGSVHHAAAIRAGFRGLGVVLAAALRERDLFPPDLALRAVLVVEPDGAGAIAARHRGRPAVCKRLGRGRCARGGALVICKHAAQVARSVDLDAGVALQVADAAEAELCREAVGLADDERGRGGRLRPAVALGAAVPGREEALRRVVGELRRPRAIGQSGGGGGERLTARGPFSCQQPRAGTGVLGKQQQQQQQQEAAARETQAGGLRAVA